MSQIIIITREGKITAKPFQVNDVASAIAEQNKNTNSPSTISDNQEETEVTEESC